MADRPEGARRLYRLHDHGLAAVEEWLRETWGDAAARFRLLADNVAVDDVVEEPG